MIDPIVPFLAVIVAALTLVGAASELLPAGVAGFLTTGLGGLGVLLCLPSLLLGVPATAFVLPIGPPGLPLRLALDPLAGFFLLLVLGCGTAAAAQSATAQPNGSARVAALGLAGAVLTLLAADSVGLAIGLGLAGGSVFLDRADRSSGLSLLAPLLLFAAVCLLTHAGLAPGFEAIRSEPVDSPRGIAAAALTLAGMATWLRPPAARCPTRDAVIAGALFPTGCYALLRVMADLCGPAQLGWWGLALLPIGSAVAVRQAWVSARHPDIDGCVSALVRRQAGLAVIGVGLTVLGRYADLPEAQSMALAGTLLLCLGGALGGMLATMAVHAMGAGAGTYRLSRLGGLVHLMPVTAAGLGAGLLTLAALPPGLGFACLWLAFQAILSAPRTGGLMAQIPLAVAAAAIAFSAAIGTASCIRLLGIAVLGRPRTPRGAGAREAGAPVRRMLVGLAVVVLVTGLLPGPAIRLLAGSAMLGMVSVAALPSVYPALPLMALLGVSVVVIGLLRDWKRGETRWTRAWTGGMAAAFGPDFGDPAAQAGESGFLPPLAAPTLPRLPAWPAARKPTTGAGFWIALAAFGGFLLWRMIAG